MVRDPVAFSYLRFSTLGQATGTSLDRQLALARQWAHSAGIPLDESLGCDKGLSGYDGSNLDIGRLGVFLKWVEKGKVRPGDYLVIEGFDRLTRQEEKAALRLILSLTGAGVRIVTLAPEPEIFDEDSDNWALMRVIIKLAGSHDESVKKSRWVRKARAAEREQIRKKEVVPMRHPLWLVRAGCRCALCGERAAVGSETWQQLPERVQAVRDVFRWAGEGMGSPAIAARLNAAGVPTWGGARRWSYGVVASILTDGRAAGRLQPRGPGRKPEGAPVEGYYPAVVSADVERRALAGVAQRRRAPGRTGALVNVFSGLLWDQPHGSKMSLVKQPSEGGAAWCLSRDPQQHSDTPRLSVSYPLFERAILARLSELPPTLLDHVDDGGELESARAAVEVLEKTAEDMVARLLKGSSDILERAARQIDSDLAAARQRLAGANDRAAIATGDELRTAQSVITRLYASEDQRGERLRLRSALRSVVERIDCVIVPRGIVRLCAVQARFIGGAVRDYLIALRRPVGGRGRATSAARIGVASLPRTGRERHALDLSSPPDAEALRSALETFDLSSIRMIEVR